MQIHLIAIGGAIMHNLALSLHQQGHQVTGSDDEIFEPSRSRLDKAGLLPAELGWDKNHIHSKLDVVILGMHARSDNPELQRAIELGLPIYSYPEFIYRQALNKKRIVVGGSHGKTTITSMIMHVLKHCDLNFDYLVGSQLEGFDTMVRIDASSGLAVYEGDEYLSSAVNPIPKFHVYKPHLAIISGIAWDHMNVFPTFENYCDQFSIFINLIEPGGKLFYCERDKVLNSLVQKNERSDITKVAYSIPDYFIQNESTFVVDDGKNYRLKVFGEHNLMNMEAARLVCNEVGVSSKLFFEKMQDFTGAAKRLELMYASADSMVYKDFAHSPSKLRATIQAVKLQYPGKKIRAFVELHTYSSLNKDFLHQYAHTMDEADDAVVFYSPHTLALKQLAPVSKKEVLNAFQNESIVVIDNPDELISHIHQYNDEPGIWLMMSSGNWNSVPVF